MFDIKEQTMKTSEWLTESISSHGIYKAAPTMKDFTVNTGLKATMWPIHSVDDTKKAIHARGLGGSVGEGDEDGDQLWGWEIAEHLARQMLDFTSAATGRGTIFRHCVEALKEKGL